MPVPPATGPQRGDTRLPGPQGATSPASHMWDRILEMTVSARSGWRRKWRLLFQPPPGTVGTVTLGQARWHPSPGGMAPWFGAGQARGDALPWRWREPPRRLPVRASRWLWPWFSISPGHGGGILAGSGGAGAQLGSTGRGLCLPWHRAGIGMRESAPSSIPASAGMGTNLAVVPTSHPPAPSSQP